MFLKICAWAIGVMLVLLAVGSIGQGAWIGGIFFVLAAALVLPILKTREILARYNISSIWRTIAFVVLFIVGVGAMGAQLPETPELKAERLKREAQAEKAAKEAKVAEAQQARSDFLIFYNKLLKEAAGCDKSNEMVADMLQLVGHSISVYDAYVQVNQATDICNATWQAIEEISVPATVSKHSTKAADALRSCSDAYVARATALGTLMKALDGDIRPSVVTQFKSQSESAQSGILLCVTNLLSVSVDLGLKPDDLH